MRKFKVLALTLCLTLLTAMSASAYPRIIRVYFTDIEQKKPTQRPSTVIAQTADYTIGMVNRFNYFTISFNKDIIPKDYEADVSLSGENGAIPVQGIQRALRAKHIFLVSYYEGTLLPGGNYNMKIPSGTVQFKDGTSFDEEINVDFTALDNIKLENPFDYYSDSNRSEAIYLDSDLIVNSNRPYKRFDLIYTKPVDSVKKYGITLKRESTSANIYLSSYVTENEDIRIFYKSNLTAGEKYILTIKKDSITYKDGSKNTEDFSVSFEYKDYVPGYRCRIDDFSKEFYFEFNKETFLHEASNAVFKDSEGNIIEPSGISNEYNWDKRFIVYKFDLRLIDGKYTVHIPEKSIRFRDRSFYEKPINIEFNVVNK